MPNQEDEIVDRIIFAIGNTHDGPELWKNLKREPETFRQAVRMALRESPYGRVGKPIPAFAIDGKSSTCSMGMAMNQNRHAVPTWCYAFEQLPPARLIELGTANGGFVCALAFAIRAAGLEHVPILTYDLCKPDERLARWFRELGITKREDYWTDRTLPSIIGNGPVGSTTYLLCDGGDKIRELRTFAKCLKPGDVIAAHDYDAAHERDPRIPSLERPWAWSEIRPGDVADVVEECDLEPFMQEHFDVAGWLAYRKRS